MSVWDGRTLETCGRLSSYRLQQMPRSGSGAFQVSMLGRLQCNAMTCVVNMIDPIRELARHRKRRRRLFFMDIREYDGRWYHRSVHGLNNAVAIQLPRRFCKVLHMLEQGAILGIIETHVRSDVRKAVGKPDNLVPSALVL
jgi:hypothetical protein